VVRSGHRSFLVFLVTIAVSLAATIIDPTLAISCSVGNFFSEMVYNHHAFYTVYCQASISNYVLVLLIHIVFHDSIPALLASFLVVEGVLCLDSVTRKPILMSLLTHLLQAHRRELGEVEVTHLI
jgi:hypothetical protein